MEKVQEYPGCNRLIWQVAVILDARRLEGACEDCEKYDKQINAWYEMALNDENEEIKHCAADSLFGFYLGKKEYAKARYFAEKESALARILERGKYHECSPMLDVVCAEKNVSETYGVVNQLLKGVDSICDFRKSE